MKLFLSADIEGTAGIVHWDETNKTAPDYAYFANQMTREVAAACEGAIAAGATDILVKDAHGSGRNIIPAMLPECARILRAWARHPYSMMTGLTSEYDGVIFTGYHSAAGTDFNPLAHTMNGQNNRILINGEIASELMMSCLIAAYEGVPVYCVTGDKGLCDWIRSVNPNIATVPVNEGMGGASISIHPDVAVRRIRETVESAVKRPKAECMYPLPAHFSVEVNYRQHMNARNAAVYPGVRQTDACTVAFEADDYMDVLKFFYFVL